jgi:2-polyprenyl-3-methyl-5-hydroxy-6-metoxy-1,4-benzoquinol methylase
MFGLGGEFWYDRCAVCGSVQLRDVPADIGAWYPRDYYAFEAAARSTSVLRTALRRLQDSVVFGRGRRLGQLIVPLLSSTRTEPRRWLERSGATRSSRILDVGCGRGDLLRRLSAQGYRHVSGVDPFIREPIRLRDRILVHKGTLDEIGGEWDLIMFHHSLEHIADQRGTLDRVASLLSPNGCCLIRIPTVSSFAWEEYRDRWVQLDAPRHLILHSVPSLERLAEAAGLRMVAVDYDSTRFQFEGSELYRRDRPLSELTHATYTATQRREFDARAAVLNAEHRGDQAAFYLRHR